MAPDPKPKAFRSEKYLKFIRSKMCVSCGSPDSIAHHEPFGNQGMATKAPDSYTISLCNSCHALRHHLGFIRFWGDRSICPEMEIIQLLTEYLKELK